MAFLTNEDMPLWPTVDPATLVPPYPVSLEWKPQYELRTDLITDREALVDWFLKNGHTLTEGGVAYLGDEPNVQNYEPGHEYDVKILWAHLSNYFQTDGAMTFQLLTDWVGRFLTMKDQYQTDTKEALTLLPAGNPNQPPAEPRSKDGYSWFNGGKGWDLFQDRVWLPCRSDYSTLLKNKIPILTGINSKNPGTWFDAILFSLNFGPHKINLPGLLVRSGIPLFKSERMSREDIPLLFLGGCSCLNVEGIAGDWDDKHYGGLCDAFLVGEGEELAAEVVDVIAHGKKKGWKKERIMEELHNSRIEGVYFHDKYKHTYYENYDARYDTTFKDIAKIELTPEAQEAGYQFFVNKRKNHGCDGMYPNETPVPSFANGMSQNISHIISGRGCSGRCSFCQESWTGYAQTNKELQPILESAKKAHINHGSVRSTFFAFNYSDYPKIFSLLRETLKFNNSLNMISSRVDRMAENEAFVTLLKVINNRNITVAQEGISERIRAFLQKSLTLDETLRALEYLIKYGVSALKIFMILTGHETDSDADEFIYELQEVDKLRRKYGRHNMSITYSFMMLEHPSMTPLQFAESAIIRNLNKNLLGRFYKVMSALKFNIRIGINRDEIEFYQTNELSDRRFLPMLIWASLDGVLQYPKYNVFFYPRDYNKVIDGKDGFITRKNIDHIERDWFAKKKEISVDYGTGTETTLSDEQIAEVLDTNYFPSEQLDQELAKVAGKKSLVKPDSVLATVYPELADSIIYVTESKPQDFLCETDDEFTYRVGSYKGEWGLVYEGFLPAPTRLVFKKRMDSLGLNYLQYFREKDFLYIFPWEPVNAGLSKKKLWEAYQVSRRLVYTPYCVRTDHRVLTTDGLKQMKDLCPVINPKPDTWYDLPKHIQVRTDRGWACATKYYYAGEKKTLKLSLVNGVELEATLDHKVRTLSKIGTYEWISVADLQVGDTICALSDPTEFGISVVKLPMFKDDTVRQNNTTKKLPKMPLYLTPELAYWCGALFGDGTYNNISHVSFYSAPVEEAHRIRFQNLTKDLFGLDPRAVVDRRQYKNPQQLIDLRYPAVLGRYIQQVLGMPYINGKKQLPEWLWAATNDIRKAFISGLFDTDGSVRKENNGTTASVTIRQSSEATMRGLQQMCWAMGVTCKLRSDKPSSAWSKNDVWTLSFTGQGRNEINNLLAYSANSSKKETLKLLSRRRDDRLADFSNIRDRVRKLYEDNVTTVSAQMRGGCDGAAKQASGAFQEKSTQYRRHNIQALLKIISNPPSDLQLVVNSITPLRVTKIESSLSETADLFVPEGHTFICEGLVNHNCLSTIGKTGSCKDCGKCFDAEEKKMLIVRDLDPPSALNAADINAVRKNRTMVRKARFEIEIDWKHRVVSPNFYMNLINRAVFRADNSMLTKWVDTTGNTGQAAVAGDQRDWSYGKLVLEGGWNYPISNEEFEKLYAGMQEQTTPGWKFTGARLYEGTPSLRNDQQYVMYRVLTNLSLSQLESYVAKYLAKEKVTIRRKRSQNKSSFKVITEDLDKNKVRMITVDYTDDPNKTELKILAHYTLNVFFLLEAITGRRAAFWFGEDIYRDEYYVDQEPNDLMSVFEGVDCKCAGCGGGIQKKLVSGELYQSTTAPQLCLYCDLQGPSEDVNQD
jgi:radical SAM superfamily enzyme YgiQ (UPF0313 family)